MAKGIEDWLRRKRLRKIGRGIVIGLMTLLMWLSLNQRPPLDSARGLGFPPDWQRLATSEFWVQPTERDARLRLPFLGVALGSVSFVADGHHGWAVGEDGVIVATQDGGASWKAQTSGTTSVLNSVHFADRQHGWAVGFSGVIVATQDGGMSWKPQASGTSSFLEGVHFADGQHGWAVGERGAIVTTQDGGANWKPQASGTTTLLRGVHFADGQHGWAVGYRGVIMATQDGGESWKPQTSGTSSDLNSVHFADGQRGWAVGSGGVIVATQDGGVSWKAQASGTTIYLNSVHFADRQHGWAVGFSGVIVATQDGGASWKRQFSGTSSVLESVHFADGQHGIVVGSGGAIVTTQDGGASWKPQTSGTTYGTTSVLNGVHFADGQHGWAVGNAIMATQDGGVSWNRQSSYPTSYLTGVHFADRQHGWAVGFAGAIVATQDGGASWKAQTSGTTSALNSVHFADRQHGWAVGSGGAIVTTQDGGMSWKPQASGTTSFLEGVHFADGQHGWAVGERGVIVATQDGGVSWKAQASVTTIYLNSVHFADGQHGWAVGYGGVIVATQDGGASWKRQFSGTSSVLNSVHFADGQRGWAVGNGGVILATQDGGASWKPQTSGTLDALRYVWFDGLKSVHIVAASGRVFEPDAGERWRRAPTPIWPAPWFWLVQLLLLWLMVGLWQPVRMVETKILSGESDRPRADLADDRLQVAPRVLALSRFLRNLNTQPPLVIAVDGEWGLGKSTLMRMLESDLRAHGSRTVWFNAWHHQTEAHLFAALLESIRSEVVPPLFSPTWLAYIVRLLFQRISKSPVRLALLLLPLLLVLGFWLPLVLALSDAPPRIDIEQTRLEAAADVYRCLVTGRACVAKTAAKTPFGGESAGNNGEKPEANANELSSGEAGEMNIPSKSSDQPAEKLDSSPIIKPLAKRLDAVWNRYEHWVVLLALGLAALPALLPIWHGLMPFPKPALLKGARRWIGFRTEDAETSYRYRFAKDFADAMRALGRTRLVLFVDDLDRCAPETTSLLLESVNFLCESGQLFVVLGIDRGRVEGNLGLAYEKLAAEVAADRAADGAADLARTSRREFARDFLKKIVNIRIPILKPDAGGAQRMLVSPKDSHGPVWIEPPGWVRVGDRMWSWCARGGLALMLVLLVAIGWQAARVVAITPVLQVTTADVGGTDTKLAGTTGSNGPQAIDGANIVQVAATASRPAAAATERTLGSMLTSALISLAGVILVVWVVAALLDLGGVSTQDTSELLDALKAWSGFVFFRHPSPREIRRVQNRLRLTIAQFDVFREQPTLKSDDGPLTRYWYRRALARQDDDRLTGLIRRRRAGATQTLWLERVRGISMQVALVPLAPLIHHLDRMIHRRKVMVTGAEAAEPATGVSPMQRALSWTLAVVAAVERRVEWFIGKPMSADRLNKTEVAEGVFVAIHSILDLNAGVIPVRELSTRWIKFIDTTAQRLANRDGIKAVLVPGSSTEATDQEVREQRWRLAEQTAKWMYGERRNLGIGDRSMNDTLLIREAVQHLCKEVVFPMARARLAEINEPIRNLVWLETCFDSVILASDFKVGGEQIRATSPDKATSASSAPL